MTAGGYSSMGLIALAEAATFNRSVLPTQIILAGKSHWINPVRRALVLPHENRPHEPSGG